MNDISDIACNDQGFDVVVDLGPGWRIDAGAEPSMDVAQSRRSKIRMLPWWVCTLTHNGIVRETPRSGGATNATEAAAEGAALARLR